MFSRQLATIVAIAMMWSATNVHAQHAPPSRQELNELVRDVGRVEALREVKDLQRRYAQFAQFGLWPEMAALFAEDAVLVWGDERISGRGAIGDWLARQGSGERGLSEGALNNELIDQPLANLSVDGKSVKVRWLRLSMTGDGRGTAHSEGGIIESEYALRDGKWKIISLRYFPYFEGPYARGWRNIGGEDLELSPYHFTLEQTGIPLPPPEGAAPASSATLEELETRIGALNAEDLVRNLQNAYGYYVDRKMWDDVVDLFAEDSALEIAGVGVFRGKNGIREAMERMGPAGLEYGQLNDYPIFDTIVEVLPGNAEAVARGAQLGMLGEAQKEEGAWEFLVFRNRFVFEQGLWKIKEMRLYPLMKADYFEGWGNGGATRPADGMLPAFLKPSPIDGRPITLDGRQLVGTDWLTNAPQAVQVEQPTLSPRQRLFEAQRRLSRSAAYEGVMNVSAAYGYYLDDGKWGSMASLFAQGGNKHSPFAGYYLGQDRIRAAATTMYGERTENTRSSYTFHWRFQPVIHISHDGRSANLRTRLLQPFMGKQFPDERDPSVPARYTGLLFTGMYPNDQAVLEDGIWRLWSVTVDEHYMMTTDWKGGWAKAKEPELGEGRGASPLVEKLPPDILMTDLGRRAEHFLGGTGKTIQWPGIQPMWFHYKNPVSGRVPEYYWPDSVPSVMLPQSRLIANGYQQPPNGPEVDGIMVELVPPGAIEIEREEN